ncbi:hypothetical protein DID88_001373 [Monilinia fructigena]|uniref:Uncharacterized protein n=1 Tax=Monilinia fructigena TaxID=38457 RepID=A0A395IZM5_9HELO|nr:hypothetical protein DID88_001373 [Monilinia fructigena]
MDQTPKPSTSGSKPSPISPKPGLKLSTFTEASGTSPSNPVTMNTIDQTPKPLSSPSRLASLTTPSSVDGQDDEPDHGITGRLEDSSTLKRRKREYELHNEETPPLLKEQKNAELINSNVNEGHIIGNVGTRTMRNKKNATGQSNPDTKLTSNSSRKELDQLGTPPPDKTVKPKNPKSTGSKKRKREETKESDIDIVNNQTQLGSSKETLPSAMNNHSILDSQDNTPSSSTSGTGIQQPSGVIPGQRIIKLYLSPAHLARLSAEQEAVKEIQEAARRAAQAARRAARQGARRAAQEAATENVEVSPQNPPSSSSTAPKKKIPTKQNLTKKNNAKQKTQKKKKVPYYPVKADEVEADFPNDNVIKTKGQNGMLVERCYGDYFVPQNPSPSLLRAKQAESADSFTYKVYLPSSFTNILVHSSSMPKYFKYTTETVSEAGLQKKAKIERMIREANGEKLMFEFDPSLGENEEIERQFANEFKFGASSERDRALEKDLRSRMKLAMTELKSIRENGLPFKEMRRYSLNFAEPTKKERIVELKQTILQQIEKERNSETYEGSNERNSNRGGRCAATP